MVLEHTLERLYGSEGTIIKRQPVSGGGINTTALLTLAGGQIVFIKENHADLERMFTAEASGLQTLGEIAARHSSPPVPRVLAWGQDGDKAFLLLQAIPTGKIKCGKDFGRAMAVLHREARQEKCGFESDNWIGSTPQKNKGQSAWLNFFRDERLGCQWQLLRKNGFGDARTEKDMHSLLKRLPDLLPDVDDGKPSLLHGDLWGGNWLADNEGRAWLIDPAVYYGHREADIAMTQLFGGFPAGFYDAYTEAWPLQPGFTERRDIYNLYHLLNHVNLFGSGYWMQSRSIIQHFS